MTHLAVRVLDRDVQFPVVIRCVGEGDEFAILRAVMDFQHGFRQYGTSQSKKICTVLDLTTVPGIDHLGSYSLRCHLIKLVIIVQLPLIALDTAEKEAARWHLFFITTNHHAFGAIESR